MLASNTILTRGFPKRSARTLNAGGSVLDTSWVSLKPSCLAPKPLPSHAKCVPESNTSHRVTIAISLIALLVLSAIVYRRNAPLSAVHAESGGGSTAAPVPVVTATAVRGNSEDMVVALGTVTALNTVTIKSRVDGQLIGVHFEEGQYVHQGDLLAEIDPRPFQVQLSQAQAQYNRDEAQLANAKTDLARYESLRSRQAVPQQQIDTQGALVRQGSAALDADRAQIESAQLQLTYSRITAPIAGRTGLRLVDMGNMVRAADPNGLLVITQVQPIAIVFSLPEDHFGPVRRAVRLGRKIPVEIWDREQQKQLAVANVLSIDNQIDTGSGTVRVKAIFPNSREELFPNEFVNIRLASGAAVESVLLPTVAVRHEGQSTFVYVLNAQHRVRIQTVTTGGRTGDRTVIQSGLKGGETVVIDGFGGLSDGALVSQKPSDNPAL